MGDGRLQGDRGAPGWEPGIRHGASCVGVPVHALWVLGWSAWMRGLRQWRRSSRWCLRAGDRSRLHDAMVNARRERRRRVLQQTRRRLGLALARQGRRRRQGSGMHHPPRSSQVFHQGLGGTLFGELAR